LEDKEDLDRQGTEGIPQDAVMMFVALTALTGQLAANFIGNTLFPAPRPRLENDPMCGLTTGGSSECFWDCEYVSDPNFGSIISNLECLLDCFEEDTCLHSFIQDYITAGGICEGTVL